MMENLVIRKGKADDADDFSRLLLLSGPDVTVFFFGPNAGDIAKRLFRQPRNLFSFEHSHFIEVNGRTAGMVLGYSWEHKEREEGHFGWLLLKYMKWRVLTKIPFWLKARKLEEIEEDEYYIASIAIYPEFRGLGLGTRLLSEIEQELGKTSDKIVLDVETHNQRAIKLYQRLGYNIVTPSLRIKNYESFRMRKILKQTAEKELAPSAG